MIYWNSSGGAGPDAASIVPTVRTKLILDGTVLGGMAVGVAGATRVDVCETFWFNVAWVHVVIIGGQFVSKSLWDQWQ